MQIYPQYNAIHTSIRIDDDDEEQEDDDEGKSKRQMTSGRCVYTHVTQTQCARGALLGDYWDREESLRMMVEVVVVTVVV